MRTARRADPKPLDVDAVRVVTAGTALWAVALVVTLADLTRLRAAGHLWWVPTCACGFLLGLLGVYVCRRRRAALRRGEVPPAEELPPPFG